MSAAAALVPTNAQSNDIVVWASIDPVEGSIGLYPSALATTFENALMTFVAEQEELTQVPFDLPLPTGAVLRASMRYSLPNDSICIEQLTQGGHRWVMRLRLGCASDPLLPLNLRVGIKAWRGEGGFGGHTYATTPGPDVWLVSVCATLCHLVLAPPLPDAPLDAPLMEVAHAPPLLRRDTSGWTPATSSTPYAGPWADEFVRNAEAIRERARNFARACCASAPAGGNDPLVIAKIMFSEWQVAADAIRHAHERRMHVVGGRGGGAVAVEASEAYRACTDEFSRQVRNLPISHSISSISRVH